MKSTIVSSSREENISFPCIAKYTASDLVVLFISDTEGISLVNGEHIEVGEYDNARVSVLDKKEWTILDNITIKFESK